MRGTNPAGSAVWMLEMQEHFASHIAAEAVMLDRYERFADTSDSEAIRYLIDMISDEEARHHLLFEDLQNAVSDDTDGPTDMARRRVPEFDVSSRPDRMLELTETFLAAERKDKRELRRLRRRMRRLRGQSLLPLVVELMELDTAKHIRILEFVRDALRHQP